MLPLRLASALLLCALLLPGCTTPTLDAASRKTSRARKKPAKKSQPQVTDSRTYTTGEFDGCSAAGDGGDRYLNELKNRDEPPPKYEEMTVEQIVANQPKAALAQGRQLRAKWSKKAAGEIKAWENKGARVTGYILKAKQEGPESCNCHANNHRDFHLWLAATPESEHSDSIVVEVSPRTQAQHDSWRLRILQRLARDQAKVRISGWMMWDQEHPEQIGKTRGTLWEIHPIHKIEVYNGGRWVEL